MSPQELSVVIRTHPTNGFYYAYINDSKVAIKINYQDSGIEGELYASFVYDDKDITVFFDSIKEEVVNIEVWDRERRKRVDNEYFLTLSFPENNSTWKNWE